MTPRLTLWAAALAASLVGCAWIEHIHPPVVSQLRLEMDSTRGGATVRSSAELAPGQMQHAEEERALSVQAEARQDGPSADLHAERALVAYQRAVLLARLARATQAEQEAEISLARQQAEAQRVAAARVDFERAAEATEGEISVLRAIAAKVPVGPADAARERARLAEARSMAAEGHLLCGAARLVARSSPADAGAIDGHLDAAERQDAEAEARVAGPLPQGKLAPLEEAAGARAACLDALTRQRRSVTRAEDADALLSALSAHGGFAPSRDERGVVVTLRGVFKGSALTPEADRELRELGHIAASHPSFPIQLVLHDAAPPGIADAAADRQRAETALASLNASGASSAASAVETMGARLPTADASDPRTWPRNARLDVVFVSLGD